MDLTDQKQQNAKLNELVAIQAIYGDAMTNVSPPELQEAVHALCAGHADAGVAATTAPAGRSCSGVLQLTATTDDNTTRASDKEQPTGVLLSASLLFSMPPDYPAAAALQCHITSADLSRATVDSISQQLQQQAQEALGHECLHDVAEALQQHLNQLQQQQDACQQQQQQQQQHQRQQQDEDSGGFRRVLLRLDHMRDRAGYTRTIKQWTAELQLTGWLLFWQSLILILLEGTSSDINTYLRQARTVCVDVDSQGRKCRERMLTILDDSASHQPDPQQHRRTSASAGNQRVYTDFRELHPQSLEGVVQHLTATHASLDATALRQMLGISG